MIGKTIGKYRFVEELGRGPLGTVYKALDETLDREVAIKVLNPELSNSELMDPFLRAAFDEARKGLAEGGIPIGSVLVHDGRIIGRGHNRRVQRGSAILHGEMDALENAGRQTARIYQASTIYTTLSPCAMCSGSIVLYGIPVVVVGENRTFMARSAAAVSVLK